MKLEKQVCSFELARKLKQLGVKQRSLFYWMSFRNESSPKEQWKNVYEFILNEEEKKEHRERRFLKDKISHSAFTVAELGEMLPWFWDSGKRMTRDYMCRVFEIDTDVCHHAFAETEANARAKMLIYLIENKLMEIK
jgi:hypothetical protein